LVVLTTRVVCPSCGYAAEERMPVNACRYFYRCEGCGVLMKPRPGDCCVYCSFGEMPCPDRQLAG
jgi:hypothetical protein